MSIAAFTSSPREHPAPQVDNTKDTPFYSEQRCGTFVECARIAARGRGGAGAREREREKERKRERERGNVYI